MKKTIVFLLLFCSITLSHAQNPYPDSFTDGKYYTVNGAKLWTVSFGEGDPIFFIAGGPGGTHVGLRSFDTLSTKFKLVYYDGFGRGKSDTAKEVKDYSLERDIEDLEGLRKAMKLDKINVLGHSYGGRYDRVAVPEMMIKYKKYCPQAKYVMFEKSGHNPQVEEPEKEFPIIIDFLSH